MKKIAIITLYGNNNFGNKLQNYALQEILKSLNFKVITIKNKISFSNKFENYKYKIKIFIKKILHINSIIKNKKREKKFLIFNDNINYSTETIDINKVPKTMKKQYDYFVYGSDQVWSPYAGGGADLYLGLFANKTQNIAYAASFGVYKLADSIKSKYISSFNNFDYLSVREEAGKKIICDNLKTKNVEVLVDPTLLLSAEKWSKIAKKTHIELPRKYVLNYFLNQPSKIVKEEISKFSRDNSYDIINILDPNDPYYVAGPEEFLYMIEHASLVCTDSFHSSVFAFIFDKPFIIFNREKIKDSMNSRIDTFLSTFGLYDCKYDSASITNKNLEHDYTEAYKILENERKKSKEFLEKALDIK